MNLLDRAILAVAPRAGLKRLEARQAARVLANYDLGGSGRRTRSLRPNALDADGASSRRDRIAFNARDMVRNNPIAAGVSAQIAANTVGTGIIPGIRGVRDGVRTRFLELVKQHCDTTDIDALGRANLYGLEDQVMRAVAIDGEALILIRRREASARLALPFQLEVVEADYLDTTLDLMQPTGRRIRNGIEFDETGRRIGYHLYYEHPGMVETFRSLSSRFVPADQVMHVYRVDRPGQQRGVSWLAPVGMYMQDLADYFDAQLMRQKIAACFAAFRLTPDSSAAQAVVSSRLAPGAIQTLGPGEDVKFAAPAGVDGLDEFARRTLQLIAAGVGLSYEALTGDWKGTNFSSGRMGRMTMDRNIGQWQDLMMRPQMLQPLGDLLLRAWQMIEPSRDLRRAEVTWTPPSRPIVDPVKEIPALRDKVRAGFMSWSEAVRELGFDPEDVADEIATDQQLFDRLGIRPEADARVSPGAGAIANDATAET